MANVRVKILVSGTVQGVFFRQTAKEVAQKLGLTGFVQNLPDGRVLAEAEGPEPKVADFTDWCHKGPAKAEIRNVQTETIPLQHSSSFVIDRSE